MSPDTTIIGWSQAKACGLKRYFTGKPCHNGHVDYRYVEGRSCAECVRLRHRKYYAEDPDKHRARSQRWRDESPEKSRASTMAWRNRNRQKFKTIYTKWRLSNLEKANAASQKWRANHLELVRAKDAKRRRDNPAQHRLFAKNRRARKRQAEGLFTVEDIDRIRKQQRNRCAECKQNLATKVVHIDHIMPLSKGGSNWPRNLQLLCRRCNMKKAAHDPLFFARRQGRLL